MLNGAKDDTVYLLEAQAKAHGVPLQYESRHKLDALAGHDKHQGVVALCDSFSYGSVKDLVAAAEKKAEPLFALVLDELEDPQNLGAILRSAEAAGVHGVLIPKNRAVGVTATVVKASAGAADHLCVAQEANLNESLRKLKDAGAWVVGADAEGDTELHRYDFTRPTVIVIGSEGKGLRRLVKEHCDTLIRIPMYGKVGSLNASVSAALFLFEVVRQRRWRETTSRSGPPAGPLMGGTAWSQPDGYGQDAARINEFYASERPDAGESPGPGKSFFVQALIRVLKRRMRARMRG
jgi:23S rRNA (guanosine2251-2'-O)-methyltransferase